RPGAGWLPGGDVELALDLLDQPARRRGGRHRDAPLHARAQGDASPLRLDGILALRRRYGGHLVLAASHWGADALRRRVAAPLGGRAGDHGRLLAPRRTPRQAALPPRAVHHPFVRRRPGGPLVRPLGERRHAVSHTAAPPGPHWLRSHASGPTPGALR